MTREQTRRLYHRIFAVAVFPLLAVIVTVAFLLDGDEGPRAIFREMWRGA